MAKAAKKESKKVVAETKPLPPPPQESSSSSSSSDSDSSDSEDDQQEVQLPPPAAPAAASSSDSSDSSSSSDSSDSEEEAAAEEEAAPKKRALAAEDKAGPVSIFVGGLPYETTEDEIRELFGSVGTITAENIPKFSDSGRIRGTAYLSYATNAEAEAAKAKFDRYTLGGRYLVVNVSDYEQADGDRRAKNLRNPGEAAASSTTLFIGNLPFRVTERDITTAFQKYGEVVTIRIPQNEEGQPKGFGYVEFANNQQAQEACAAEVTIGGRQARLDFATDRRNGGDRNGGDRGGRGGFRGGDRNGGRGGFRGGDRNGGRGGDRGGDRNGGFQRRERW